MRVPDPQGMSRLSRGNMEIEDLASALAHGLKEPLSLFTEVLVREVKMPVRGEPLTQFLIDAVTRMSALYEGLQAFARRDLDGLSHSCDLEYVVAIAVEDLDAAIRRGAAIVTADPLPRVLGPETPLLNVFKNLILNAITYRRAVPPKIHITAERLGLNWIIKVNDNGIGVAHKHHEEIFDLLKRLHGPEIPGAGMGLAICRKTVEALGGNIWVESEPGVGSTFCFTIAAAMEKDAGSAPFCPACHEQAVFQYPRRSAALDRPVVTGSHNQTEPRAWSGRGNSKGSGSRSRTTSHHDLSRTPLDTVGP